MKAFIIFLALILCFSFFITFFSDFSTYIQLQQRLKMLAEDIASGSALFCSAEEYSDGKIVFDKVSAENYAAFMVCEFVSGQRIKGDISVDFIYDDCSVSAIVDYVFPDLFRLPFLSVTYIRRASTYQWEE